MAPIGFDDLFDEHAPRRRLWQRAGLVLLALVCFALGVLGWLIPIMSGVPFHVGGLFLVGMVSPGIAKRLNGAERRLPQRLRKLLRPRCLVDFLARRRRTSGQPPADQPVRDDSSLA